MIQFQCPKCGQQFTLPQPANQVTCPICGEKFNVATTIPPQPQQPPQYGQQQQPQYGSQQPPQYGQQPQYAYGPAQPGIFDPGPSGKSRGVAGLLAIILGYLGVHYFYLGHTTAGLLSIALSFVTCGSCSRNACWIRASVRMSQAEVESSSTRIRGRFRSARAMQRR